MAGDGATNLACCTDLLRRNNDTGACCCCCCCCCSMATGVEEGREGGREAADVVLLTVPAPDRLTGTDAERASSDATALRLWAPSASAADAAAATLPTGVPAWTDCCAVPLLARLARLRLREAGAGKGSGSSSSSRSTFVTGRRKEGTTASSSSLPTSHSSLRKPRSVKGSNCFSV